MMPKLRIVLEIGDRVVTHEYPAECGFAVDGRGLRIVAEDPSKMVAFYLLDRVICVMGAAADTVDEHRQSPSA